MERGVKAPAIRNMNELQADSVVRDERPLQKNKAELAAYYSVGLRTIEEWSARGIISGSRTGRKMQFDVADCDRRISSHRN